jgi:hypothetical protein
MLSFGIKNLRRLFSLAPVQIRPITILVGRNSSGKSSFLRAFPLVRQSLMTRTSSPILWYGDFVDFGGFEGAISDNDTKKSMSLLFGLDKLEVTFPRRFNAFSREIQTFKDVQLEVKISMLDDAPGPIVNPNEKTQISSLNVKLDGGETEFDIRIDDQSEISEISLNGINILNNFDELQISLTLGTIFPEFVINPKEVANDRLFLHEAPSLIGAMAKELKPHLDRRIKNEALYNYSYSLLTLRRFDRESLLKLSQSISAAQSFKTLLKDMSDRDSRGLLKRLHNIYHANRLPTILGALSSYLTATISETLYIGPARARSERYYRYQDLSVSEIDSDGKNFPMFLNSLNPTQLNGLSDWVEGLFGYRIEISRSIGHLSINLIEGDHSTNIVDTGYGVSQILPVLGQIWWAANRRAPMRSFRQRNQRSSILAIEQPELHLHPAHQALLADAFAAQSNSSSPNDPPLNFLVETHSETLVNRLGELIAAGRLKPESVQILIFEPAESNPRETNVSTATFNERGELINWPYGFFQPGISE